MVHVHMYMHSHGDPTKTKQCKLSPVSTAIHLLYPPPPDSRTWSHLAPPSEAKYFDLGPYTRCKVPSRRYGHTMCEYQGRVYMYGGRNDEDGSFAVVECYDISEWCETVKKIRIQYIHNYYVIMMLKVGKKSV